MSRPSPARAAALAVASAVLASPAGAEPRQFGNVLYDLPADWSQGRAEGGTQVLLFDGDDDVCPYCSLTLGVGAPATGDLAGWLDGQALALVEDEDRGSVERVSGPEMVQAGGRTVAMLGQRVDTDIQILFAFDAGDRYELVGFQGWAYDEEEAGRTLGYFQASVAPLVEGMEFVSEGAQPLLAEPMPGDLDGLWWGWNQGFTVGLDMMMVPTTEFRTVAFWRDGRFYDGTPPAGLAPLDPAALAADPNWGTYVEEGGALVLSFADGRTERLEADGPGWSDGTRTLSRVKPLPDGAALDGRVSDSFAAALGPATGTVSGSVYSESEVVYRPDGTYAETGSSGAAGSFSEGGGGATTGGFAVGGDGTAATGTYEVRDGLVIRTPADGSPPESELGFANGQGDLMIGELFLER